MIEFAINENNKALWDNNFINVELDDNNQSCGDDGLYKPAEPLNNDPIIQEYGAVTDILKHGYFNKDYKIFNYNSTGLNCFVSKESFKLYDCLLVINDWENFKIFVIFLGTTENDTKYLFKYYHTESDSIRNYTITIK